MEDVIVIILKSSDLRIYKYYAIISKPQLPKQKEHKQIPFCLTNEFNINYAKTKIMFQLSNGQ